MKKLLLAIPLSVTLLVAGAQTSPATGSKQNYPPATPPKKTPAQVRGTGQYHGSKDTTPGSPMGTGGAGGNEMSGSPAASASNAATQPQNAPSPATKAAPAKGTSQYHGSKDTTPGSPMGTGGAGGNEMSGSPAGSAAENAIQPKKGEAQTGQATGSEGSKAKKSASGKKSASARARQL